MAQGCGGGDSNTRSSVVIGVLLKWTAHSKVLDKRQHSPPLIYMVIACCFFNFLSLFLYFERESQAGSILPALLLDAGLEPTNQEIKTGPKSGIGRLTNWATQGPLSDCAFKERNEFPSLFPQPKWRYHGETWRSWDQREKIYGVRLAMQVRRKHGS